jgi:hypothetical protein
VIEFFASMDRNHVLEGKLSSVSLVNAAGKAVRDTCPRVRSPGFE